jgi:SAM-dependent methyltransferase
MRVSQPRGHQRRPAVGGERLMATACWKHLTFVIDVLRDLRPESVLDVGTGFGKYGFLVREYLDVYNYRIYRRDWKVVLDGIEAHEPYIMEHQRYLYNSLHRGDACRLIENLGQYDMVIAGDMVEHQEKANALRLLAAMTDHARKWVLISIPLGRSWPQEEYDGNQFDAHRSEWSARELRGLGFDLYFFRDEELRPYCVGILAKSGARQFRRSRASIRTLLHALESRIPALGSWRKRSR